MHIVFNMMSFLSIGSGLVGVPNNTGALLDALYALICVHGRWVHGPAGGSIETRRLSYTDGVYHGAPVERFSGLDCSTVLRYEAGASILQRRGANIINNEKGANIFSTTM